MYALSILFHCCFVGSLLDCDAFTSTVSSSILPTIKVSPSLFSTTTKIYATTKPSDNDDEEEIEVYGGPPGKYMPPKFIDGVTFNLFKSKVQDDEDTTYGAFTPPPNSLTGKVILITGASSGLGLESCKRLALAGATIVLTARTNDKVVSAVNAVKDYCKGYKNNASSTASSKSALFGKTGCKVNGPYINSNPQVKGITLDLDDLSSVKSFPDRYEQCIQDDDDKKKIHVLMNNAGGGGYPSRVLTVDKIEKTFQSNHLGHFVLTSLLFKEELLNNNNEDGGCTVINVSSVTHRCAIANYRGAELKEEDVVYGFDFDNINCDLMYADDFKIYAQGKLANIIFTRELQRRANNSATQQTQNNSWLKAVSIEPGGVTTDIWRHSTLGYDPRTLKQRRDDGENLKQPKDLSWKERIISQIFYRFGTQVERGANVQVWLAYLGAVGKIDSDNGGGKHYDEYRKPIPVPEYARDVDVCKRLWEVSEEMAGIEFSL